MRYVDVLWGREERVNWFLSLQFFLLLGIEIGLPTLFGFQQCF